MRSSQVLFYLVEQSLSYENAGLSVLAGEIVIDDTEIAISNNANPATIESEINAVMGAGFCDVTLVGDVFTIVFHDGGYHTMTVDINGVMPEVTDITTPTPDMVIAEQVNIGITREVEIVDTPSKDMQGAYRGVPVGHRLVVSNENIYMASDDNYKYLQQLVDNKTPIFAYVKMSTGDYYCSALISSLDEKASLKDVVRATVSWGSTGKYNKVT